MSHPQKYFWAVVLSAIVLGFAWPAPGLFLKPSLQYLLMAMMFFTLLKIDLRTFKKSLSIWWRYFILLFLIFIVPVAIVFLNRSLLEQEVFIGLIIVAAAPSAVSAAFLSDLLGGEPAKALVASTLSHLVSPIATPFLVYLFAGHEISINFWEMQLLILKLVFIPLFLAQAVKYFNWDKFFTNKSSSINTWLLFILIWGAMAPAGGIFFTNFRQVFLLFLIVLIIMAAEIFLSARFGRTAKEDVTWEVVDTYKNFILSSVIAITMFGPTAVLGSVVYAIANNFVIIYLQFRKK